MPTPEPTPDEHGHIWVEVDNRTHCARCAWWHGGGVVSHPCKPDAGVLIAERAAAQAAREEERERCTPLALSERLYQLEAALRPFAKAADLMADTAKPSYGIWVHANNVDGDFALTVADCQRARAALASGQGEESSQPAAEFRCACEHGEGDHTSTRPHPCRIAGCGCEAFRREDPGGPLAGEVITGLLLDLAAALGLSCEVTTEQILGAALRRCQPAEPSDSERLDGIQEGPWEVGYVGAAAGEEWVVSRSYATRGQPFIVGVGPTLRSALDSALRARREEQA